MKVEVRHSTKQDISKIADLYAQPSCFAGTLQLPMPSLDRWQKFLGEPQDNFYSLVAVVEGELCGQLGMEVFPNPRRKHVANIGMAVSEAWQGKGIGSKLLEHALNLAENWLAIRRVELEVYTDNEAAIALYQKHGFVIEGTAKDYAFRDRRYVDVHLMAKVVSKG